jgi:uncharacterized protein DUF6459
MPELSALRPANVRPVNVRLVKVPDAAPPYDCQVHGAQCPGPVGQTVAATVGVAPAGPERPAGPALRAAVPRSAVPPAVAVDPAAAWPRRLAVVIVEVLAGVRPDRQLVVLATDRVRARIAGLAPLLACDQRPRITRIVTSRPTAQVVEMTVVANFGPRSRALALRVEHMAARPTAPGWPGRPARWLCTAIEAG